MKHRFVFLIFVVLATFIVSFAQTKVVTNDDLEAYKQQRLSADREYRENYAKLGFSSPEEYDRRLTQSRVESEQLSAKLRNERLERERLDAQRQANEQAAAGYYQSIQPVRSYYSDPGYFWSYSTWYRPRIRPTQYYQPGYFAGGQFWPTGSPVRPQPVRQPHVTTLPIFGGTRRH